MVLTNFAPINAYLRPLVTFDLVYVWLVMAFFSGLKAAYDSLGSEINKTFVSSQDSPSSVAKNTESTLGVADEVFIFSSHC